MNSLEEGERVLPVSHYSASIQPLTRIYLQNGRMLSKRFRKNENYNRFEWQFLKNIVSCRNIINIQITGTFNSSSLFKGEITYTRVHPFPKAWPHINFVYGQKQCAFVTKYLKN